MFTNKTENIDIKEVFDMVKQVTKVQKKRTMIDTNLKLKAWDRKQLPF
jgi:hypothetical protein